MRRLLCMGLAVLLLAGCKGGQATAPTPTPTPVGTSFPTPAVMPTPEPTPVIPERLTDDMLVYALQSEMPAIDGEDTPAGEVWLYGTLEEALADPSNAEKYFCVLGLASQAQGEVSPTQELEQRGFRVLWGREDLRPFAAICTADMLEQLEDSRYGWRLSLCRHPEVFAPLRTPEPTVLPEGYRKTMDVLLAHAIENQRQQIYSVGVFLKGTTEAHDFVAKVWQHGGIAIYDTGRSFFAEERVGSGTANPPLGTFVTQDEREAYMKEKLEALLKRHGIQATYSHAYARLYGYDDGPDGLEKSAPYLAAVSYFEATLSPETLKALMEDEDVFYIDWNEEAIR